MSDHDSPLPDDQNGAGDPLVARLRSGLDALADRVDGTPPALSDVSAVPAMARPGARRWMLGAAAAAVVATVVGAVVVTARDDGGKEVGPSDTTGLETLDPATVVAASPEGTPTGAEQRYRAVGMVLEDSNHGPQLCLGPIMESYPPQCGGLDITNWSWDDVEYEAAAGIPSVPADTDTSASIPTDWKWGDYVVVGRYDAEAQTFTLSQPAREAEPGDYTQAPDIDFTTPCAAPDGGWPPAPESDLIDAAQRVQTIGGGGSDDTGTTSPGQAIEGFGGLWLSLDPNVLNVRVAGDVAKAAAAIREFFDGPLCLVPSERSLAELRDIQSSIDADPPREMSTSNVDVVTGAVVVELTAPNAEVEKRLTERHGDAVSVRVSGLIPIVPGEDPDPGPGTTPGTAGPVVGTSPGAAGPAVGTAAQNPDTPVSSPAASNGFERLDIELSASEPKVMGGRSLTVRLRIRNDSGETVTDPGCVLGSGPHGLVPADDRGAELWQQIVIDCSGPMPIPDGFDKEYGEFTFYARTSTGDPLPPGKYVAAMEIDGYPGRLEAPVTVT